jgi:hypothetical protein
MLSLFGLLHATNIATLSKKLRPIICEHESIVKCDNQSYIIHNNKYFKLDNNKILVFFRILNPNDSPYSYGTVSALVIFDANGDGKIVDTIISGDISSIKRDPKSGIWLSHPWSIEGTMPSLSYTKDGQNWQNIIFPNKRPRFTIEWIEMCLLPNTIALEFAGEENRENYWETSYSSALQPNPNWKQITQQAYNQKRCLSADAVNNHWQKRDNKDNLDFYNNSNSKKLIIPNKIYTNNILSQNLYSIQIGHFNLKESLNIVSKEFDGIRDYSLISKELPNYTYKLFLGTFKTSQEAKKALNRLKRKYKKNRYINEAFMTSLPK